MSIATEALSTHSPEEYDPMARYYGQDAFSVAQELFGEDFTQGSGVMFTDADYVPHRMEFTGTAIRDINMITGKPSGIDGIDGVVVSQAEAEHLARLRIRGHKVPVPEDDLRKG